MNDVRPDREDEVVCYCSGTTATQIKTLIEQGVDNLDRLSRMTGACSGCGACEFSIMKWLSEPS